MSRNLGQKLLLFAIVVMTGVNLWLATPPMAVADLSPRFDWPDETANYFWAVHFAREGNFVVAEPLNQVASNQVHPRSFNVRTDGSLVPGSFLGMTLIYGTLAKVFSIHVLPYLTPILGALGILAWYGILRRIFSNRVAAIASVLALIHPAWWYYSATALLPNVPFVSLFLISLYLIVRQPEHHRGPTWQFILSGLALGCAIAIRPSEIIWVGALTLVVMLYRRDSWSLIRFALFGAMVVLAFLPSIYYQQLTYGNFLTSGYDQLSEVSPTACQSCQIVESIILPFGFHPSLIAINVWTHLLSRVWWLTLLGVLGLIAYLVRTHRHNEAVFGYTLLSLFIGSWLATYYGSWQFSDQLTVALNTLGLSYVRYWLPLYLLSTPFMALGLVWLTSLFKERYQKLGLIILVAAFIYPSARLVLYDKADSLFPVRDRVFGYTKTADEVIRLTEPESVIITVRKDKVFFPERKVVHTFNALSEDGPLQVTVAGLLEETPVYYYALGPEPILELPYQIKLEPLKTFGQEILYRVK